MVLYYVVLGGDQLSLILKPQIVSVCLTFSYYVIDKVFVISMDGKYILTGGEDDLVQVWSMEDRKVVAWGEGHNSWVRLSLSKCGFLPTHYT